MDVIEPVDPAFAPLLADPRAALRPPRPGGELAAYRRRLDLPMAAVAGPPVASVETLAIDDGVALRVYAADPDGDGAILFFHGGGFVIGSLATHDAMARALAVASGLRVVSVGYRLAPEAPFPAARDDGRTALRHVAARWPIAGIVGDSAGGHLAVVTACRAAATGIAVGALALLYPVVAPALATASWARLGAGHLLERDWMRWAWDAYLDGADPTLPDVALLAADLAALPPTRIITAAADPLRDEGEALGAAIRAAGGRASVSRYEGMIHGFASLPMLTPRAGEAVADLAGHVRQHER